MACPDLHVTATTDWTTNMDTADLARLADRFAVLAELLRSGGLRWSGTEEALDSLTRMAVDALTDADLASITVEERGSFRTMCSTDPVVEAMDQLQYTLGQGPCLQACQADSVLISEDLRDEERWPEFAKAALEHGIHSVMSIRLQVQPGDHTPASLNIYARKPWAFSPEGAAVSALLMAHIKLALEATRAQVRAENLEKALDSNRAIGVAMGILMARHNVTEPQSFVMLRRASQGLNRKIRDIADQVAQTGELPVLRSGQPISSAVSP